MSAFSKELRSFLVVSQSESIRDAANRLNISAPALSRQMQILERSYGVPLLVRSTSGVALTKEGESLRKQAMTWLSEDADLNQSIRRPDQAPGLRVRLGIMEGLVDPLVPRLVSHLASRFERVELELVVGSTVTLLEKADEMEIDLIVAYNMPRLSRLIIYETLEFHLGVCFSPDLGLSGEGPIEMQDALKWPLCLPSSALSMHTRLIAEILSVRVNPKVAISTNSINAILSMVRAGQGITFLPWIDVSREIEAGRLAFRPLASRRLTETLSLAVCRGNRLGDMTGKVLSEVETLVRKLGR